MELKKQKKNKNQETDGYETDKRPRTEKLKRKEITLTEKLEKNWNRKIVALRNNGPESLATAGCRIISGGAVNTGGCGEILAGCEFT